MVSRKAVLSSVESALAPLNFTRVDDCFERKMADGVGVLRLALSGSRSAISAWIDVCVKFEAIERLKEPYRDLFARTGLEDTWTFYKGLGYASHDEWDGVGSLYFDDDLAAKTQGLAEAVKRWVLPFFAKYDTVGLAYPLVRQTKWSKPDGVFFVEDQYAMTAILMAQHLGLINDESEIASEVLGKFRNPEAESRFLEFMRRRRTT